MLDYLSKQLTKGQRRQVAKYMTQYRNMDAIIRSKQLNLVPSKTSTIKEDAVQETNVNLSEADKYLEKSMIVDDMAMTKYRLDIVYDRIKPLHKMIWDEHFINQVPDFAIYYEHENGLTKRSYYREKNELMAVVAEALKIGTKVHQ